MTSPLDAPGAPAGDGAALGGGGPVFRFETGFVSHRGRVRTENEDRCFAAPEIGVFTVADGMGGHADGAFASETVVEALASIGTAVSAADLMARLEDRILRANSVLWSAGEKRGTPVGSTVAVLLIFGADYACVWSGDSRIYRVRAGSIVQLTRDHTEGRDLFEQGLLTKEQSVNWPRRHVITRAVGARELPEVELEQGAVQAGDVFVICSDGLTGPLSDEDILLAAGTSAPQWACDALLSLALDRGAPDNVTVVIVRCGQAAAGGRPRPPVRPDRHIDVTNATVAQPGPSAKGRS